MELIFSPEAQQDLLFWKQSGNKKVMQKIEKLLNSILQSPLNGIGKPEALRFELSGCYSRRIDKEHRLVYRVLPTGDIEIISLRYHY